MKGFPVENHERSESHEMDPSRNAQRPRGTQAGRQGMEALRPVERLIQRRVNDVEPGDPEECEKRQPKPRPERVEGLRDRDPPPNGAIASANPTPK